MDNGELENLVRQEMRKRNELRHSMIHWKRVFKAWLINTNWSNSTGRLVASSALFMLTFGRLIIVLFSLLLLLEFLGGFYNRALALDAEAVVFEIGCRRLLVVPLVLLSDLVEFMSELLDPVRRLLDQNNIRSEGSNLRWNHWWNHGLILGLWLKWLIICLLGLSRLGIEWVDNWRVKLKVLLVLLGWYYLLHSEVGCLEVIWKLWQ